MTIVYRALYRTFRGSRDLHCILSHRCKKPFAGKRLIKQRTKYLEITNHPNIFIAVIFFFVERNNVLFFHGQFIEKGNVYFRYYFKMLTISVIVV